MREVVELPIVSHPEPRQAPGDGVRLGICIERGDLKEVVFAVDDGVAGAEVALRREKLEVVAGTLAHERGGRMTDREALNL